MAADVDDKIYEWSTTEGSNKPTGATAISTNLDDNLRMIQAVVRTLAASSTVASATTTDIGAVDATFLSVSGTTTITGLGTVVAGIYKWLVFEGALTLTHNATSLILPSGASITTAAGDSGMFVSLGSGNWRCLSFSKASGNPLANSAAFSDGTVSAPGISFLSDLNSGFYRIGADNIGVAVNATKVLDLAQKTLALTTSSSSGTCAINATATGTGVNSSIALTATSSGGGSGTIVLDGSAYVSLRANGTDMVIAGGATTANQTVTLNGMLAATGVACTNTGGESGVGAAISGNASACTFVFGGTPTTSLTIQFGVTYDSVPVVVASYEGQNLTIDVAPTTSQVVFTLSALSATGDKLRFITIA